MSCITKETSIRATMDQVYDVGKDPHRWASWYVGLGRVEKLVGEGHIGTVVDNSFRLGLIPVPVTVRVMDDRFSEAGVRWRADIEGPLDAVQTWTCEPVDDGTRVTVEMEYGVPGLLLGAFADRLWIRRYSERVLERAIANLKRLCEGQSLEATSQVQTLTATGRKHRRLRPTTAGGPQAAP